jgi:GNAT superfamily N-acetyltransferase
MWVAEADGEAVGFVTATLHHATGIGEIYMPAVDPRHQGGGIGTALTETARNWFQASGMRVAMIETGGDPGHPPARRIYEKAGLRALPIVRFFKARLD